MKGTGLAYTLLCALLMATCAQAAVLQEESPVLKRYAGYADYADYAGYADNAGYAADYAADYAEAQSSEATIPLSLKVSLAGGSLGSSTGGATYIRWGRTTCPDGKGTKLVYAGTAAGSEHNKKGGTSDILCLPDNPEYLAYQGGVQNYSPLMGTEYESQNNLILHGVHDWNVPCAVCHSTTRGSMIKIPARLSCPDTWTLEYSGYLMSGHQGHERISAECVDKNAVGIPGSAKSTNGALFYFMEATCNGIKCPPYVAEKELTCAVCTK